MTEKKNLNKRGGKFRSGSFQWGALALDTLMWVEKEGTYCHMTVLSFA